MASVRFSIIGRVDFPGLSEEEAKEKFFEMSMFRIVEEDALSGEVQKALNTESKTGYKVHYETDFVETDPDEVNNSE